MTYQPLVVHLLEDPSVLHGLELVVVPPQVSKVVQVRAGAARSFLLRQPPMNLYLLQKVLEQIFILLCVLLIHRILLQVILFLLILAQ